MIEQNLYKNLHLVSKNSLLRFFNKNNSFMEVLRSKIERIVHFILTGCWINKAALSNFAADHPTFGLSSLFKQKKFLKLHCRLKRYEEGRFTKTPTFYEKCKEAISFIQNFFRSPSTVGSLAPSSKSLSKTIVNQIAYDPSSAPRRILEVGPGSGSFTDKIIKRMNSNDVLYLVEYDKNFCEQLRKKYGHIKNIKIFEGSILDFESEKFDFIVSGLPLNGFEPKFVKDVFKKFKNLSKEGTKLSYFEYMLLPEIKMLFTKNSDNLKKVLKTKEKFYQQNKLKVDNVWKNFTPARVRHHEIHVPKRHTSRG